MRMICGGIKLLLRQIHSLFFFYKSFCLEFFLLELELEFSSVWVGLIGFI